MKALQLDHKTNVNPTEVASMKIADGYHRGVTVKMRDGESYFVESGMGDTAYETLDKLNDRWNEALK